LRNIIKLRGRRKVSAAQFTVQTCYMQSSTRKLSLYRQIHKQTDIQTSR